MDNESGRQTEAGTTLACPGWCDGRHPDAGTFHYGSELQLNLPGGDGQPGRPLLKLALMADIKTEADALTPPSVDVEGMTDQELDAAGLAGLMGELERYLASLRDFQRRYGEVADAVRKAGA